MPRPQPTGSNAALPSISLVTCSYQQARYLEPTLWSVLEQGYPRRLGARGGIR